jgi:hypothetical protein
VEFVALADDLAFALPADISPFLHPWAEHEGVYQLNTSWPPPTMLELIRDRSASWCAYIDLHYRQQITIR